MCVDTLIRAYNVVLLWNEFNVTPPLALPLWQQPHACRAQDVDRRLLVFALGDMSSGKAQERREVVAGMRWRLSQCGDT